MQNTERQNTQQTDRRFVTEEEIDIRYRNLPPEKQVFVHYGKSSFICRYNEDFLQGLTDAQLLNDCRDTWPKSEEHKEYRKRNNEAIKQARKKTTHKKMLEQTDLKEKKQKNEELEIKTKGLEEKLKLLKQVKERTDEKPGQPIASYLEGFSRDDVEKIIDCLRTSSGALELGIEVWLNWNGVSGISSPPNNSFNTSSYASALPPTSSASKRQRTASLNLNDVSGISNPPNNSFTASSYESELDIESWLNCDDVSGVLNQPTNRLNDPSYESASAPTSSAKKRKDALHDHDYTRKEQGNPPKIVRF